MKLAEVKAIYESHIFDVTVGLFVKDSKLLLGRKAQKIGKGLWNGPGGKVEPGESIEQAMVRECQEELGMLPLAYRKAAVTEFYNFGKPEWTMRCHMYLIDEWEGEPTESAEMAEPTWFSFNEIPWEEMWGDDKVWLPLVLEGKYVEASFLLEEKEIVEQDIVVKAQQ